MPVPLKIKLLTPTAIAPVRQHPTDSGLDLHLDLTSSGSVTLQPYERFLAPTGIALGIPEGYEVQIRSRSGLAAKYGVRAHHTAYESSDCVLDACLGVLNEPATIDQAYTGEIKVILINYGMKPITFSHGDRIAQMVIAPVCLDLPEVELFQGDDLESTDRGSCGFGFICLGEK